MKQYFCRLFGVFHIKEINHKKINDSIYRMTHPIKKAHKDAPNSSSLFNSKTSIFYQNIFSAKIRNVLLVLLLLCTTQGMAITIKGTIRDSKTKETIPFANVVIKNTIFGTQSDMDGNFALYSDQLPVTLIFKFIGYKTKQITIEKEILNLDVLIQEDVFSLNEVTVKPDNYYERSLLRKIVKSRKRNNPKFFTPLSYNDYTRTTVFLANMDIKATQKKKFKQSADAFVHSSDSTVMMPFFMNETIVDHHIDQKHHVNESKEIAHKTDGILSQINTTVNSIINRKLTTEYNFYNNQINILERGFPSPLSNTALLYYNIYLTDSTLNNNTKYYKFNFFPKSYKNITFKGHFWVEDKTWALTEIKAALPNSANLNFVKDLEVLINYKKMDDNHWFYNTQKIKLKLSITKKENKKRLKRNFSIQRLICYREVNPQPSRWNQMAQNPEAQDNKAPMGAETMLKIRQEVAPLDTFEMSAYSGIRKLRSNKFIKAVDKFSAMTLNGYYNLNKVDLGPYFSFYRKNEIEGNRVTLPLRTSEKLSKKFSVGGYVGYGSKNKELAYGGKINYLVPIDKRTVLSANYHYDYFDLTKNRFVEFIRENPYQQGGGNIVSSFTTVEPNPYMIRNKHTDITLEHQLSKGVGLLVRPSTDRYYSNYNLPFNKEGTLLPHFDTQNMMLDLRLSFSEDFDQGYFSRIYYGNQKPVFHITTLLGRYELPQGKENKEGYYANVNLSVKNRFNMGPTFMKMLIEGGAILGDVPFPLLQLPKGTRDIGAARYHFNLLHHTSFASDLYMSAHLSLNGGGFIFNKLPLVKHLNLREIFTFKAYFGKLLGNHNKIMQMPDMLRAPMSTPYMEASMGITNIFKCLRIEYVNRINRGQSYNEFSSKHGIRMRIEVTF